MSFDGPRPTEVGAQRARFIAVIGGEPTKKTGHPKVPCSSSEWIDGGGSGGAMSSMNFTGPRAFLPVPSTNSPLTGAFLAYGLVRIAT